MPVPKETLEALRNLAIGGAGGAGIGTLLEYLARRRVSWRGPVLGGLTGATATGLLHAPTRGGLAAGWKALTGRQARGQDEARKIYRQAAVDAQSRIDSRYEYLKGMPDMFERMPIPGIGQETVRSLGPVVIGRELRRLDEQLLDTLRDKKLSTADRLRAVREHRDAINLMPVDQMIKDELALRNSSIWREGLDAARRNLSPLEFAYNLAGEGSPTSIHPPAKGLPLSISMLPWWMEGVALGAGKLGVSSAVLAPMYSTALPAAASATRVGNEIYKQLGEDRRSMEGRMARIAEGEDYGRFVNETLQDAPYEIGSAALLGTGTPLGLAAPAIFSPMSGTVRGVRTIAEYGPTGALYSAARGDTSKAEGLLGFLKDTGRWYGKGFSRMRHFTQPGSYVPEVREPWQKREFGTSEEFQDMLLLRQALRRQFMAQGMNPAEALVEATRQTSE